MKFGFYTLGCKVNQYETQAMERLLLQRGQEIGAFEGDCDAYVVNTCSVTAVADKKSRAMLRRCRREHPQALLAVCGCYAQHAAEDLKALGVDVLGGSAGREEFVEMLLKAMNCGEKQEKVDAALRRREFEVLPAGGLEERTRAMLKVQDGCTNFCTYCIIPYTRGPVRSAPLDVAVAQAQGTGGPGLPGDRGYGHRDRFLGPGPAGEAGVVCSFGGAVRSRAAGAHPFGVLGTPHHHQRILRKNCEIPESLPAIPPFYAIRV